MLAFVEFSNAIARDTDNEYRKETRHRNQYYADRQFHSAHLPFPVHHDQK